MANLSNINNKFIVTDGGQALVNQTVSGFNPDADDLIVGNLSGNTGITIASGSSAGNYGSIYFADAAGSSTASKAGYIRYEQNTSKMTIGINAVEKVAIALNGDTTFSGNVNIVTASTGQTPYSQTNQLVIENTGNSGIQFLAGTTNFTGMVFGDSDSGQRGQLYYDNNTDSFTMITSATTGSGIFINSSGDVGIGTDSPTSKLHLRDPGVNSDVGIKIGNDSRDWNLQVMGSISDSFQIFTHDNSNVMTILPSGNVGIGTTSPTSPAGVAKFLEIQGSTAGIVLHDDGNDPYEIWASGGSLVFRYNNVDGGNGMLLSSTGNLGIGSTSPTARLDILTNSATGDNNIDRHVRFRADNGEQRFNFFVGRSGNSSNLQMYDSSEVVKVVLNTSDNSYFNGGNVGIGTTSPSYGKLQIDQTSGNNLTLRKGTGSPAIAFGGVTNNEATFLLEGNPSTSGFKIYNGSGTLASPTWTAGMDFHDGGRLHPYGGVFLGSSNNDQLLKYYKEGTWTPIIQDLSGNQATLSAASGTYTKIGRQVFLNYRVQLSSKASMTGSYVLLGGLPFNHPTGTNGSGTIDYFQNMATGFSSLAWDTTSTGSVCWLVGNLGTSSTSSVYVTPAQLTDTTILKGTIIYMAVT